MSSGLTNETGRQRRREHPSDAIASATIASNDVHLKRLLSKVEQLNVHGIAEMSPPARVEIATRAVVWHPDL